MDFVPLAYPRIRPLRPLSRPDSTAAKSSHDSTILSIRRATRSAAPVYWPQPTAKGSCSGQSLYLLASQLSHCTLFNRNYKSVTTLPYNNVRHWAPCSLVYLSLHEQEPGYMQDQIGIPGTCHVGRGEHHLKMPGTMERYFNNVVVAQICLAMTQCHNAANRYSLYNRE